MTQRVHKISMDKLSDYKKFTLAQAMGAFSMEPDEFEFKYDNSNKHTCMHVFSKDLNSCPLDPTGDDSSILTIRVVTYKDGYHASIKTHRAHTEWIIHKTNLKENVRRFMDGVISHLAWSARLKGINKNFQGLEKYVKTNAKAFGKQSVYYSDSIWFAEALTKEISELLKRHIGIHVQESMEKVRKEFKLLAGYVELDDVIQLWNEVVVQNVIDS